jgi:glycosyltransferase involved in cell wall biosynthesis
VAQPVEETPGSRPRASLPRVLFLSGGFHPLVGGAERQLHGLARTLRQAGAEILVVTQALPGLPSAEEIDGIPVRRWLGTVPPTSPLYGLTYMLATLAALARLRDRHDVVHCQQLYLHVPAAVAWQAVTGRPVIVRLAGTGETGDVHGLRAMRGARVLQRVAVRAHRFVAVSRASVAEAVDLGVAPDRVVLIPNAALLSGDERDRPAGAGEFLLFVGVLRRGKGLDVLLDALARATTAPPLCVVGDGPERAALETQARELGIADRVRFVGEVADPSPYYARARLFVFPSWAEGLSNALLEAMSYGLPVVATRIGGNVDVVEDGVTGLLVEPGRPADLAAALEHVLRDESLAQRLGAGARAVIRAEYTLERTAERYLQLYRSALGATAPAAASPR